MIDVFPKKLIKKALINNWDQYSANLNGCIYLDKYMGATFKEWVENFSNPLSIPWLIDLLNNKVNIPNNNFGVLEREIGEANLKQLFLELENLNTKQAGEVIKKYLSLTEELKVFNELNKTYKDIKKIHEIGDWKHGNKIISVKSILNLDYNYAVIESIIRGQYYIEENDVLRIYNKFELSNAKHIDDIFRAKVEWFLNNVFIDHLKLINNQRNYWDDVSIKSAKFYLDNYKQTGYLEVHSDIYRENEYKISLLLTEDRAGEQDREHCIKIILDREENQPVVLDIDNDYNSWWESPLDWAILTKRIQGFVEEYNDKYKIALKQNCEFEGWIVLMVHPKNEDYIIHKNDEIMKCLRTIIGIKNYRIKLVFYPEIKFDFKEPVIFEL